VSSKQVSLNQGKSPLITFTNTISSSAYREETTISTGQKSKTQSSKLKTKKRKRKDGVKKKDVRSKKDSWGLDQVKEPSYINHNMLI